MSIFGPTFVAENVARVVLRKLEETKIHEDYGVLFKVKKEKNSVKITLEKDGYEYWLFKNLEDESDLDYFIRKGFYIDPKLRWVRLTGVLGPREAVELGVPVIRKFAKKPGALLSVEGHQFIILDEGYLKFLIEEIKKVYPVIIDYDGVVVYKRRDRIVGIKWMYGKAPTPEDLCKILRHPGVKKILEQAESTTWWWNWRILKEHSGMSGATDYIVLLQASDGTSVMRKEVTVHISMYGKLNELNEPIEVPEALFVPLYDFLTSCEENDGEDSSSEES